jgi:hypothetical protein
MAVLTWPAQLPIPQIGAVRTRVDPVARATEAGAPPIARLRYQSAHDAADLSWVFSDWELAFFETWWHVTANAGRSWVSLTLRGDTGAVAHTVRLAGGYRAEVQTGGVWRVSATADIDRPAAP